jgi:predicted esterase YcpF (UPF0227 family)
MKEMLTDELINDMAERYQAYTKALLEQGEKPLINFEGYVERILKFRAWRLRKGGINVKI